MLKVPMRCGIGPRPANGGSAFWLVFVGLDTSLAVLAHGTLHAFAGDQEHRTPADVHAVISDTFEVVDHEGGSHAPLRGAGSLLARVHHEVHRLRIEQVYLIVGGL